MTNTTIIGGLIVYKYDLHIHTDETSPCGHVQAKEMIKVYHDCGYQGVVITDHLRKIFFRKSSGTTWCEKVDDFLTGYYHALEAAQPYDMDVLLGVEIAFMENNEKANDFLIYGITERLLKDTPDLIERGLEGVIAFCREHNLLIYQAHPMRGYCYPEYVERLDGIEVHNGNPRHDSKNADAEALALEQDKLMISGSDYHDIGDEDSGGIMTSERIYNNEQLVKVLRSNAYTIYRGR